VWELNPTIASQKKLRESNLTTPDQRQRATPLVSHSLYRVTLLIPAPFYKLGIQNKYMYYYYASESFTVHK
jgi:hypothetical protein